MNPSKPGPTGILTFLFTDLESSTPLWERAPALMQEISARHDEILREAFKAHNGRVVKSTGDGFHVVFELPADGLAAALAGQQALAAEHWPDEIGELRVRMGLHTGESQARDNDYFGPELNRAARIMGIAYGGQILVSSITAGLVRGQLPEGSGLIDLGLHRLKGLQEPEQIFQVKHPSLRENFPPLPTAVEVPNNLPVQRTNFIGRVRELDEIRLRLADSQLLTLFGPGGTGKTRLMLQAAGEVMDRFQSGAWLVELAPLSDENQVIEKVAAVLGVQENVNQSLIEALAGFLRRRELLLLLDNVEHLVQASAELAEYLLDRCPGLTIVTTSREPLFIDGETVYQVPSLSIPAAGEADPDALQTSEAVRFFIDRAKRARLGFELTDKSAAAVGEIVRRLDGIPLALELAAARLQVMSAEQIASHLNDRFRLLVGGRRTALPRQQTLQALIDWSWNLLDEAEQVMLRRLAVFSGGWTTLDLQQIAGVEPLDAFSVLDKLDSLVHKSLVVAEQVSGEDERFHLLENIRQYALARLIETGAEDRMRARHARYYADLVREADQAENPEETINWLHRLVRESDNLRQVIDWLEAHDPIRMVEITGKLISLGGQGMWWFTPTQARRWLERAILVARQIDPPEDREEDCRLNLAICLSGMTGACFALGRHEEGLNYGREAVDMLRLLGDTRQLAFALAAISFAAVFAGHWEEAGAAGKEAYRLSVENDHIWPLWISLGALGATEMMQGNIEAAGRYVNEVNQISAQLGSSWIGLQMQVMEGRYYSVIGEFDKAREIYHHAETEYQKLGDRAQMMIIKSELSHLYRRIGRLDDALPRYQDTLRYFQEVGHDAAVANTLENIAFIALALETPEEAGRLLGAAEAIRSRTNHPITIPWEQADKDRAMEQLADMLGEDALQAALEAGRGMSVDEAVALTLQIQTGSSLGE